MAVDRPVDRSPRSAYGGGVHPRFLKLSDVAERLNATTRVVYGLVRSGELEGIQVGGMNQWRVPEEALLEYMARNGGDDDEPLTGARV